MIVPRYWAEARIQKQLPNRQLTVRRFGWSNDSIEAAQQHADTRAKEAFEQIASGATLPKRERKVGYSGSDGLPIREEILHEFEDSVVTRNSYGAQCLNTPQVFIADLDVPYPREVGVCFICLLSAVSGIGLAWQKNVSLVWGAVVGFFAGCFLLWFGNRFFNMFEKSRRRQFRVGLTTIKKQIAAFVKGHKDWHLRSYRTPNGYRIIALHKLFDPRSTETTEAFATLGVDPIYALMCQKQNCFRARLTAKPWRIGKMEHLTPRPGVWPIKAERLPERYAWTKDYDHRAVGFAACRFEAALGATHSIEPVAQRICDYHDRHCKALTDLEIA